MILSDNKILKEIEKGTIVIEPFDINCLGSNSYDVHLGNALGIYSNTVLDSKTDNQVYYVEIPEDGIMIHPHQLYLGVTKEYTETHKHVPFLEGKSSIGRLGIDIHATAGKGDVGFCNYWTLEISCTLPVKIYAGMPIGQLIYQPVKGKVNNPYNKKKSAKYNQKDPLPMPSQMWKNFK